MSKTLFKVSYRNCKISSAKDQQRRAFFVNQDKKVIRKIEKKSNDMNYFHFFSRLMTPEGVHILFDYSLQQSVYIMGMTQ